MKRIAPARHHITESQADMSGIKDYDEVNTTRRKGEEKRGSTFAITADIFKAFATDLVPICIDFGAAIKYNGVLLVFGVQSMDQLQQFFILFHTQIDIEFSQ